jgi:nucleotide-binding universal stress UspA family protein
MEQSPRPVVVGVDASEAALRATRFAAEAARLRGAPLRIVHALGVLPDARARRRLGDLDVAQLIRDSGTGVVERAADTVAGVAGPAGLTSAVLDGDPVAALRAESAAAQLVVVGARGAGGLAGLLLGSTATGVAADAHCPVVVLPDETTVTVRERRSVVVGVEGRPGDDEVLALAFTEAALRGTDLVAVHAWQDAALETAFRSVGPLVDWGSVQDDEERVLGQALAGWAGKEPDVPVREVVLREKTAAALVSAGMTAQLLVVGHRPRRSFGSTTHGVLHRAVCPVAVVPLPARSPR